MLLLMSCDPVRGGLDDVAARLTDVQKRYDVQTHIFADLPAERAAAHMHFHQAYGDFIAAAGISPLVVFRDGVYHVDRRHGPIAAFRANMPDLMSVPGDYKKHAQTYIMLARYFSTKEKVIQPKQIVVMSHESAVPCKTIKKLSLSVFSTNRDGFDMADQLLQRRCLLHPALARSIY